MPCYLTRLNAKEKSQSVVPGLAMFHGKGGREKGEVTKAMQIGHLLSEGLYSEDECGRAGTVWKDALQRDQGRASALSDLSFSFRVLFFLPPPPPTSPSPTAGSLIRILLKLFLIKTRSAVTKCQGFFGREKLSVTYATSAFNHIFIKYLMKQLFQFSTYIQC